VQALPPTLEPLESISNVGLRLTYNVFDTLLRRDFLAEAREGGQRLVPHLATALTERDPLTWEVALRQGVRLQDGGELTAEDVRVVPGRLNEDALPSGGIFGPLRDAVGFLRSLSPMSRIVKTSHGVLRRHSA
jgi:peptide/nickel transport system substrate-binding protein